MKSFKVLQTEPVGHGLHRFLSETVVSIETEGLDRHGIWFAAIDKAKEQLGVDHGDFRVEDTEIGESRFVN